MKTYEKYLNEEKDWLDVLVKKAYYEGWDDCEEIMFDKSTGDCFPSGFTNILDKMQKKYYYKFAKNNRVNIIS